MEGEIQSAKKHRLEWLDALRGFTMILVVANHVSRVGFEQNWKFSTSLSFLLLFRMPLFFFVSGFLAYKASQVWDVSNLRGLLAKKLKIQLIPTIVFWLLFNAIIWPNFLNGIDVNFHSQLKGGYWFTIALLWMFIFYYLFSFLESKLHWNSWFAITLFFVISLGVYTTCYLPDVFQWAQGYKGEPIQWLNDTSLSQVFLYFPFFIFGNIVHRYWNLFQRVMDISWFYPIVVIIVTFSTLEVVIWHATNIVWTNLFSTLAKFGLLIMVFMYFRYYKEHFTKFSVVGNSLQYIGRRTLDIYLIHFFFLPNMPTIGMFFNKFRHNFVLDTVMAVVIALVIIAFCVIVSNILRISPLFRKYLFGRS